MRFTHMRPWLAATLAPFAIVATTIAVAPHAHADDEFYLDLLNGLDVLEQYGDQRMLEEGRKICGLFEQGASEDSVNDVVESELGISRYEAYRVVTAAEFAWDCLSLKFHQQ